MNKIQLVALVLLLFLATELGAEESCVPEFLCADGDQPAPYNDVGYDELYLQLADEVIVTRLFQIKSKPATCQTPCKTMTVGKLISQCGAGSCIERGNGYGCCQECSDDPNQYLSGLGVTCSDLVASTSCNTQLVYFNRTVGGYPYVREVCPNSCKRCVKDPSRFCPSCKPSPQGPACTTEGFTIHDGCELEGHNCVRVKVAHKGECLTPIYGVITKHSSTHISLQQTGQFCNDNSVPRAMCPPTNNATTNGVTGPTFDGAWVATQHTHFSHGTALASPNLLGPGVYVRAMYSSEDRKTIGRVDIMQVVPETYDFSDLDVEEREVTGTVRRSRVGGDLWLLLHISSSSIVFNVTSSTRVRNFNEGNGVPVAVADLSIGMPVTVSYIGSAFPFPNVVQATRLAIGTQESKHGCANLDEMWCGHQGACSGDCTSMQSLCQSHLVFCDGACKDISRCTSQLVDVWGVLIRYTVLPEHCQTALLNKTTCTDGSPAQLIRVHIGSRNYTITSATRLGSQTGWALDPLDAVQAATTQGVRVEVSPSHPNLLYSFSVISFDLVNSKCGDDPTGIFALHNWACDEFLVLGCDYNMRHYSNLFPPGTPLRKICMQTCGDCGNTTELPDICQRKELDDCLAAIVSMGCPSQNGWDDLVVCKRYRFCSQVNKAVAKYCQQAPARPQTPCSSEKTRAEHNTVGAFVPACSSDGIEWLPKQCQHDICWCVDTLTGVAKPGTHTNETLECGVRDTPVDWCPESFHTKICSSPRSCPAPLCYENSCGLRTDNCCAYKCKELLVDVDAKELRAPRGIYRKVKSKVLTVTLRDNKMPQKLEHLHDHLVSRLRIRKSRLVLSFQESRVIVKIALNNALLYSGTVKPEAWIKENIATMQDEQEKLVLRAEELFKSDEKTIDLAGSTLLVSNIGNTEEYMEVSTRAPRQLKYVADFGDLGNVTFTSNEFETVIKVDLPGLKSSVPWVIHREPICDGHCPPVDNAVYNPLGTTRSSQCMPASGRRFQRCRVGDLVHKHGDLIAGSKQQFVDTTLPLNGWASILGRILVLGTEPPVCAMIGKPFDTQLVAEFTGAYLRGTVKIMQSELGRDTQVASELAWRSLTPPAQYQMHIHTDSVGKLSKTKCDDAGQHYNPLHIPYPNKCPKKRTMQSVLNCEIGDLSGKYGVVEIPGKSLFTDPIMDTVGDSDFAIRTQGNGIEAGMSIVIHSLDGERIDCANLALVNSGTESPTSTGGGSTNDDDKVNTIILMVGVLLAVFIVAALIGYLARHYVAVCLRGRAAEPTEQEKEIVIPVGRSANIEEGIVLEMSEMGEEAQVDPEQGAKPEGLESEDGGLSHSSPRASQSIDPSQIDTVVASED